MWDNMRQNKCAQRHKITKNNFRLIWIWLWLYINEITRSKSTISADQCDKTYFLFDTISKLYTLNNRPSEKECCLNWRLPLSNYIIWWCSMISMMFIWMVITASCGYRMNTWIIKESFTLALLGHWSMVTHY